MPDEQDSRDLLPQQTNDLEILADWAGRTQTVTAVVSPETCTKLLHTLGRKGRLVSGDRLPPLWHFISHVESVPASQVGRDGHPKRGGFLPPVALPRRMWAGGRFVFNGDLHIGDEVAKTSTVDAVTLKEGRSGLLCFVTVRHELSVDGEVRIFEEQDLVYREDPDPDVPARPPKPAPEQSDFGGVVVPDEVMLFRYSALTFNGHRIHYDRAYATEVEGYRALVFHGPLTATLLADLATASTGRSLHEFSFRGLAPLFDDESFTIAGSLSQDGDAVNLWAATASGGVAMEATATLGPAGEAQR